LYVLGSDGDGTSGRHCVSGVEAQVQYGQLQFAGIDFDRPHLRVEVHLDMDVASERAIEHLAHAFEVSGDIDGLGIDWPSTGERQQMSRQSSPPGDSAPHAVEHALPRLRGDIALEQLQSGREYREQVVEVMRDSAGELGDRFHLLRLPKSRFGVPQALLIV
jgi:hypothetical protein